MCQDVPSVSLRYKIHGVARVEWLDLIAFVVLSCHDATALKPRGVIGPKKYNIVIERPDDSHDDKPE